MYPDNKNRALRASELAQDCGDLSYNISNDKEKIDSALQITGTINLAVSRILRKFTVIPPSYPKMLNLKQLSSTIWYWC